MCWLFSMYSKNHASAWIKSQKHKIHPKLNDHELITMCGSTRWRRSQGAGSPPRPPYTWSTALPGLWWVLRQKRNVQKVKNSHILPTGHCYAPSAVSNDALIMPEYTRACQSMPEYARVCQSMPEYARVCQSMPEYAIVCQSMPEYARVCQSMPEYAKVCNSMPDYARVCQSMTEYARVCKSMPEYAKVCQSMPEYSRVCQSLAKFCLYIAL